MTSKASLTEEVMAKAESYDGVRARIVRLEDVLKGRSYRDAPTSPRGAQLTEASIGDWPAEARTVLLLGLNHPETDLRLDYWEQGDTWGNRRLREVSESIKQWFRETYDLAALPLPYHVERGGVFLKDAAVLSGMGVIGRNNLLLHPQWGPRIRLRSILLEGDFQTTETLEGFAPCETCEGFCLKACPMEAFPHEKYRWTICVDQINANVDNKVPDGEIGENGTRNPVIKYCRACELACPVGA